MVTAFVIEIVLRWVCANTSIQILCAVCLISESVQRPFSSKEWITLICTIFFFSKERGEEGGRRGGFDPPFLHKFHSNPEPRQREILHSAKQLLLSGDCLNPEFNQNFGWSVINSIVQMYNFFSFTFLLPICSVKFQEPVPFFVN